MESDQTMKIVTNLDRGGIEAKLGEVRALAQSRNFTELASHFSGVGGMPRAQFEQGIANGLKWLTDKPVHSGISSQLELVELNLRNL